MIIGDPKIFAVESQINQAYLSASGPLPEAEGYVNIHIGGKRFGRKELDVDLVGSSLRSVADRIAACGKHTATFACLAPNQIAWSVRSAIYAEKEQAEYFGYSRADFRSLIYGNSIKWIPNGNAAFDDRSFVLHFDIGEDCRLIAFNSLDEPELFDPSTLRDVTLSAEEFYGVLKEWSSQFEADWRSRPKLPLHYVE